MLLANLGMIVPISEKLSAWVLLTPIAGFFCYLKINVMTILEHEARQHPKRLIK